MKPQVEAFVDEEAGDEVAERVRRRLQHFIDRKIATQFDPLLAMGRDENLTGLARGFAFRLTEALGVLPREGVAGEVKALEQEARGLLRKHGVRFGQFTIFLPALLKPAPTRLRLVLWSLFEGLAEFPESPPPGLVTIPNLPDVPKGHYTLSGYHPAGERAIRIDMLERLADLLRTKDTKAGFESTAEMLSITGMTPDQFAGLMEGLGYKGTKAERPKVRVVEVQPPPPPVDPDAPVNPIPEEESVLAPVSVAGEAAAEAAADGAAEPAGPEMETFWTFVWSPKPRERKRPEGAREGGRGRREGQGGPRADGGKLGAGIGGRRREGPREGTGSPDGARRDGKVETTFARRDGKPGDRPWKGKPGQGKGGDRQGGQGARTFESRPERRDRIDPDNPFAAALMALRDKT
jgi:ATP-dependent RNA helicase SUPV3L1/SUV3